MTRFPGGMTDEMTRIRRFANNKTHVPTQFFKYVLAGGMAAATHIVTFTALNESFLPADQSQLASGRGWNFFASNAIAFVFSTLVAYIANRAFVFQSGRHGRGKEVIFFSLLAAVGFFAGTPLGSFIVSKFAINEYFVFVLVVAISASVNFLGRKYWVFLH